MQHVGHSDRGKHVNTKVQTERFNTQATQAIQGTRGEGENAAEEKGHVPCTMHHAPVGHSMHSERHMRDHISLDTWQT